MAVTAKRAHRWRNVSAFVAAVIVVSSFQVLSASDSAAQVKPPSKQKLKAQSKRQSRSPSDSQADQLNEKWLSDFQKSDRLRADKVEATAPAPAPVAEVDDERTSSVPSMVARPGAGARTVVADSAQFVRTNGAAAAFKAVPAAAGQLPAKELSDAFAGFAAAATVELTHGRTADGTQRLLYASIGEGNNKQSYWWFSPLDQPEGWFDEHGRRLGGTGLTDPRPGALISSPFGIRRYYGRRSGAGFHNGIDYEGKNGEPIYAAGDGVINHQGWYFNYGRTVKISHADNFETLYAHMSRFVVGIGPGTQVRKGDVIGYVGSTGRSTGAHLHFSTIVNGEFVDPAPYISESGGNSTLSGMMLGEYRQWQQEIRRAADRSKSRNDRQFRGLQGADPWGGNPFSSRGSDRL